jgi:preprotein translocase subunit SecD
MKFAGSPFNIILVLGILFLTGCETTASSRKGKKEVSTFRVHLETHKDTGDRTRQILFPREQPATLTIEVQPILTEANVAQASVTEGPDGFSLRVQLDRRGVWLLENYSATRIGRRLVIFSDFGRERWLAAPVISRRVPDGVLVFTPDATLEEAQRIARGLNYVAAKIRKNEKF